MDKTIKEAWKEFCRYLYQNVVDMEKSLEKQIISEKKSGKSFLERIKTANKLRGCEEYKNKIIFSSKNKEFDLKAGDDEIILKCGYDYYFKFKDPVL